MLRRGLRLGPQVLRARSLEGSLGLDPLGHPRPHPGPEHQHEQDPADHDRRRDHDARDMQDRLAILLGLKAPAPPPLRQIPWSERLVAPGTPRGLHRNSAPARRAVDHGHSHLSASLRILRRFAAKGPQSLPPAL